MPAANALATASFNLGFTAGPLLGGVVIGWLGLAAAYTVDCVTYTAALYALWRLPSVPPLGERRRAGLSSVLEGLRYLRTRPNVLMTFLVDMCAMVLAQPRALFPAMAVSFYGGGTRTVGLLAASPAIGALLAVSVSGWIGRIRRQGLAVMLCVIAYGAAVAGVGLTRTLWAGVLLLAASGAADMVSSVYRNTILQVATPDEMRGRLQGVFIVVVAGGPRLGDFVSGSVASLTTERLAIIVGGLACIAGVVLLGLRYRGFARYDARHPVP
jgi:MFS family permease